MAPNEKSTAPSKPIRTPKSSGDPWRTKLALKRGRLQFRSSPYEAWQSLASVYDMAADDLHPELPNVQEIILSKEGIVVHQYDFEFDRSVTKAEPHDPQLGWELEFPLQGIKEIFCEQRAVPSWKEKAPPESTRTINSIRFEFAGRPKSKDISRFPKPAEGAGAAVEVETSAAKQFPLAELGTNLQPGMEIRLAFEGDITSTNFKTPHFWIWPMVVHILAGTPYNAKDRELNRATLNKWAEANPDRLERTASSKGVEWRLLPRLNPKTRPAQPILPKRSLDELEQPEKRQCMTIEEMEVEVQRLEDGMDKYHAEAKGLRAELREVQTRLSMVKKIESEWTDAWLEKKKEYEAAKKYASAAERAEQTSKITF